MQKILYEVINRKTNEVEVVGTMRELADKYHVHKTAIWQAERRQSHFLRFYLVRKCETGEVADEA